MTKQQRADIVLFELKKLYPNPRPSLNYSNHWELVIAVLMSAQTTDKQVNVLTKSLFQKYQTLDDYLQANIKQFTEDIKTIGLYKTKAKNILAAAKIYDQEFDRILPKTISELIQLPGVGRKTANVVLGAAYTIAEGVAVDTHVTRLAKKFGLTKNTDPKKIEQDLMKILPKEEWALFTNRMVHYGRDYSPARKVLDETDPISLALKKNN